MFPHSHAFPKKNLLLQHLNADLLKRHKPLKGVCVPGGEELDEFVGLLLGLVGHILEVLQVVRGYEGQIPKTACNAAATQTGNGGVGGGAQARVGHWRRLPLAQEVRCI